MEHIDPTKSVYEILLSDPEFKAFVFTCLNRHVQGNWGHVSREVEEVNDRAPKQGLRLQSAYNDERFPKHGAATIWIITEADQVPRL